MTASISSKLLQRANTKFIKLELLLTFVWLGCSLSCHAATKFKGYLQLGLFNQQQNAQKLLEKTLVAFHLPTSVKVIVKPQAKGPRAQYAVIIEGFDSRAQAQAVLITLKNKGYAGFIRQLGKQQQLYRMMPYPAIEKVEVDKAFYKLQRAKKDPEYLLSHQLDMPKSPDIVQKAPFKLSMREAILLSLRYSADLLGSELDRILSRYQLRIEQNAFELQYAMQASNNFSWTRSNGSQSHSQSWSASPAISRKTRLGTELKATFNQNFDGSNYTPQLALELSQPLLRGAGRSIVEQPLNDRLDTEVINKIRLKQTYIDKVTSVISAYRSLIQQKNTVQTQLQSLKDAKYTLWVNKKRIAAGELEPTGNIQQEYQVANLGVTLEGQRNQLEQAKRNLLQLIGLDPTLPIIVPSNVDVGKMRVPDKKQSIHYGLTHNIGYLSALVQYRITKRAYKVAENQQLWALNLTASQSYGAGAASATNKNLVNITNGRNQASSIGLTLDVPINDLNRRSTLISAKVALEKARLNLLAQKRQLETDIINRLINIQAQVNQYQMNQQQLALAQRAYDIEVKKRKAGISTALDVTNTQNQLINARNSLINTKIAYLEGRSALEQLLGTTLDVWHIKMRV